MCGIVQSCPTNLTETTVASLRLKCDKDRYGNDQYLCLPNAKKTDLVEFCHRGGIHMIPRGYCVETEDGLLYPEKCQHFSSGCPSQHYLVNEIYRYPACQDINIKNQCYFADPSCPNLASSHTTKVTIETTSSYLDISNTTLNTVFTTTSSGDMPTNIGAIAGGISAGVFAVVVLLIVLFLVLKRRRAHKGKDEEGVERKDEEKSELLGNTDKARHSNEETSHPPTENGRNITPIQIPPGNKQKDYTGKYKQNLLHEACRNGKLEMCQHLIQTNQDLLHSVDNGGWNAALQAARGGNVEILQLLADKEVDVKHKNNNGWNILHVACLHSNLEMSRYIIQTYPDLIHNVTNKGWNAALYAARGGNVEILQLLADKEVDVKHKNNDGWDILNVACGNSNLEMSRYIIQTYPDLVHSVDNDGWNAALHAARGGNVEILQLLADKEVEVKHKSNKGWNSLHMACQYANLEMSRYIIKTYPDLIHSVDNDGWNAASYAARGGNVEILKLLT